MAKKASPKKTAKKTAKAKIVKKEVKIPKSSAKIVKKSSKPVKVQTAKKSKSSEKVLKTIDGKQVARNLIVTIDGKKYNKLFPNVEDRKEILKLIDLYNRTNSPVPLKKIVSAFTEKETKKTKEEEEKKATIKGLKKVIKNIPDEEVVNSNVSEVVKEELESNKIPIKELDKVQEEISKPVEDIKPTTGRKYRGEY